MAARRDDVLAWKIAGFTRAKKLPSYKELTAEKKNGSMADLKATLKGFGGK